MLFNSFAGCVLWPGFQAFCCIFNDHKSVASASRTPALTGSPRISAMGGRQGPARSRHGGRSKHGNRQRNQPRKSLNCRHTVATITLSINCECSTVCKAVEHSQNGSRIDHEKRRSRLLPSMVSERCVFQSQWRLTGLNDACSSSFRPAGAQRAARKAAKHGPGARCEDLRGRSRWQPSRRSGRRPSSGSIQL